MKGQHTGMDTQYSWKRTEEIEIDLADLLKSLCRQWKRAVLCGFAAAALFGLAGWLKAGNRPDAVSIEQETAMAEEIELSDMEQQAVDDAVQMLHEVRGMETYLENSVLMQIDPYQKSRYIMLYCIDRADRRKLPVIMESYLNFIINGGAAEQLVSTGSWNSDKTYLTEIMQAYQKSYSSPYLFIEGAADDSRAAWDAVFYVEITGKNAKEAQRLAMDVQDVLEVQFAQIRQQAGNHRLKLTRCTESKIADSALQAQQHDRRALLSASRTNLRQITDAFTTEQMTVYMETAGIEADEQEEAIKAVDITSVSVRKYMVWGLACGIVVYGGTFAVWYLFCDKVKSTKELRRLYVFPVYGSIPLKKGRRKTDNGIPVGKEEADECGRVQVLYRIKIACQKQCITKLYAVSEFSFSTQEKESLQEIAGKLESWGISMKIVEKAITQTLFWDGIAETGHVLLILKTGTDTHCGIDEVMDFYMENGVAVIGAAVFSQNE